MEIKLFLNATILDATKDMIKSIDKSDFSKEHIIVVPDKYSLQAEKTILSLLGDSLFNVRVLDLTKLASEILQNMSIRCETVSESESLLLTQKAIDEVAEQFKVFKKGDFAFCQEMNKLIGQLKSSCVESGELATDAEGLSGGKYHDIKLVYEKYNELLGGRLDANGKLMLASRFADANSLKDKNFYFGYFDAFTAEGYSLIENLMKFSCGVAFSQAHPLSVGNEYLYENDIQEKIIRLASQFGESVEVIKGHQEFSQVKTSLLKGVLSYEKIKCNSKSFYSLLGGTSIQEEVSFVAKTIFYLLHRGYKYSDIAVYVSDLTKYQSAITRIFNEFNFVYFLDDPLSVDKTLVARAVKSLFAVAGGGYQKEDIIAMLQNPIFESEHLLDVAIKKEVSGRRLYKGFLASEFKYDWFFTEFDKCRSVKDYCNQVRRLLEEIYPPFDNFWTNQKGKYLKEESINRQAYDFILECLDLLEKYDSLLSGDEFFLRLKGLFAMTNLSSAPTYIDGLNVGDQTSSSYEDKKVVFILGGQDLPLTVGEGGLLTDSELKENYAKEISPTIRMINRRNRFKLFSLLPTAKEKLIVTYQIINEEGKKNELPSYLASLNDIFSQKEEKISLALEALSVEKEGRLLAQGNKNSLIKENLNSLSQEDKALLEIDLKLPFAHSMDRDIYKGDSQKLFFGDDKFSASELETYFSCPFKHFIRYGLNIKEKQQKDFSPADIGNICHKMAEDYVCLKQKESHASDKKQSSKEEISKFVINNFDKVILSLELQEKLDECEDKKQIERYLKAYLTSFLCDVERELSHSLLKPLPPEKVVSGVSLGGYTLKGRADRVDEGEGYFKIVDYKTGKTKDVLKDLYFGNKLQLFLYATALMKQTGLTAGGVFYFNAKFDYATSDEDKKLLKGLARNDEKFIPLLDFDIDLQGKSNILSIEKSKEGKNGMYKGRAIANEDFSTYLNYALKVSGKGIGEIKEGFISPCPTEGACERCSFRGICLYSSDKGQRLTNGKINFEE